MERTYIFTIETPNGGLYEKEITVEFDENLTEEEITDQVHQEYFAWMVQQNQGSWIEKNN